MNWFIESHGAPRMSHYFRVGAIIFGLCISGCAATASPYGEPPDSDDPWQLIRSARAWLQEGRPRGATPSLRKALHVVDGLRHDTVAYAYAKSSIHNELGRVYEMVSELDLAETEFALALEMAKKVPGYRPLHFDIAYNLSTVYERKKRLTDSCKQLRHAASLAIDILNNPAEQPFGYGANSNYFIMQVAEPRMVAKAKRIGCNISDLPLGALPQSLQGPQ